MSACICIVGWHLDSPLYDQLSTLPLDVYVLWHRPAAAIPATLRETLTAERILVEPNIGYDWGAYQQFLQRGIHQQYETIFFMHDDVILRDTRLFELCEARLAERDNQCVIGNGAAAIMEDLPRTHIHCYAHSAWKPPTWSFRHSAVRGSFFATSRQVLDSVAPFEILWDHHGLLGEGAGNWSLRATCGKIQAILGEQAFDFVSEEYRSSPYLDELERGDVSRAERRVSRQWILRNRLIVVTARRLMTWYMNSPSVRRRAQLSALMQQLFSRL